MSTSTKGLDKPANLWYYYFVQLISDFMISDCVSKIVISIPSRTFHIFSDLGDEKSLTCETPEQFQRVLDVCLANSERTEIQFDY